MRRAAIFVFYDCDGHADEYIKYNISRLRSIVRTLFIVVNGNVDDSSYSFFKSIADNIIIRDNLGFDAAAYKEAFFRLYNSEDYSSIDEIVFMNDTFYGPFCSWSSVFERMDGVECDLWGMTAFYPLEEEKDTEAYRPYHIQTYFFVCRNRLIHDESFIYFWNNLKEPKDYLSAVGDFEVRFSQFLLSKGFVETSFAEENYPGITDFKNEVIFSKRGDVLFHKCNLPVMKYKSYIPIPIDKYILIKEYLVNHTNYNIRLINEHQKRLDLQGKILFSEARLCDFCRAYSRVYIYGDGKISRQIQELCKKLNIIINGIVVSNQLSGSVKTVTINDIKPDNSCGVIIGMNRKNCGEILNTVRSLFKDRVFFMNY